MERPRSRSRDSPTRARASPRGRSFSACPGSARTVTTSLPDAVERGGRGAGVPAPARSRRARGRGRRRARRDGTRRGPLLRRSHAAACDVVGITGTNGKTTTAFLVRHLLEAGGRQYRAARHGEAVVGGERGGGRAHHARGDRPAGHLPAHARRRRPGLRRWRCPRTRSSSAAPTGSTSPAGCSPTSPRTTSTSTRRWRTTSRPSGGCSTGRRPAGGERRRPVRAGGSPTEVAATTFAIDRDADYRARDVRFDLDGLRVHARRRRTAPSSSARRCPACSTSRTCWRAVAAARALGVPMDAIAAALPDVRPRARALRARGRGAGLRRARGLRPHAGLARERAARGPRDHARAAAWWCSAPAATATAASAR